MADVTGTDRGQLLLITALLLAVVFVALAILVNSGIYAENLATRKTGSESGEVAQNQDVLGEDLQDLIGESNEAVTEDNYTAVKDGYDDDLETWATSQERRFGSTGRFVQYERQTEIEGTLIRQTDIDRNYTAGGSIAGQVNWSLVNETTAAGQFEFLVQRPSLLDATDEVLDDVLGESFHLLVETTSGDRWRIYFFRGLSPATGYLLVEEPGGFSLDLSQTLDDLDDGNFCASTDGDISVDVVDGTFGGEDCPQLDFYADQVTGTSHNISYRNTKTDASLLGLSLSDPEARVNGTYTLTVRKHADRTPYYAPTTGDDPHAKAIIYEASVSVEYRSSDMVYRNMQINATWDPVA